MNAPLHEPWLVAAWPGMGGVAQIAATTLVKSLGAELLEEIPTQNYFDVTSVPVEEGVVGPPKRPRNAFHGWRNPSPGGRDILVFLGDQQPQHRGYEFCGKLLDVAERLGVTRVHTFAAMAAPVHPAADPSVYAVATRRRLLEEITSHGLKSFESGELSGLNGVLVSAAASREMDGLCLLGEFPFFAVQIPNPKAARAVLSAFGRLADLSLDTSALDGQIAAMEPRLVGMFDAMQSAGQIVAPRPEEAQDESEEESTSEREPRKDVEAPAVALDAEAEQRIEALFEETRQDRSRANELKAELDRHGVFKRYEDRFLDLFRQAG